MKNIGIYILLLLPLWSCDNLLNLEPQDSVTFTNYFKSEADLEGIFVNMLSKERAAFAPKELQIHDIVGLKCDEFSDPKDLAYRSLVATDYFRSGDTEWKTYYDMIYLCNMLEDNRYRFENVSESRADFWLAQANFCKALAYFRIAQTWGDAPIIPNSAFSDPIVRSSAKEVLEEALRCAKKALILPKHDYNRFVNAKGQFIASKQYASLGTVYTLMANINAWMGGLLGDQKYWEEAEKNASEVIENRAGYYKLETDSTSIFNNLFGPKRKSTEVIFTIDIDTDVDIDLFKQGWEWAFYPGSYLFTYPITTNPMDVYTNYGTPQLQARIKTSTVKALYPVGDRRRSWYWRELETPPQDGEGKDIPYAFLYKWRKHFFSQNPDFGDRPYLQPDCDRVVWRLADLILLRAECRARLGLASAKSDLQLVRERAGLGEFVGSDIRREIFRERERELFGEGKRYYDAVRNGYLDELPTAYQKLTPEEVQRGALYLPISDAAQVKNELMKQNVYWSWKK